MSRSRPLRVLVTGAEETAGLSVIRGLGQAGATVIACGSEPHAIGFASRYAAVRRTYTSPLVDRARAEDELVTLIARHTPDVVIPVVESTLVALNQVRAEVAPLATLAAPPADTLEYALDKSKTLRLGERLEVPVPSSIEGSSVAQILHQAADMRFPVAVKPRGPRLHPSTAHRLGFTVSYARSLKELAALLEPIRDHVGAILVQEFVPGIGRCVAAVCQDGQPVAMFAYSRVRELPHTGGVSVLRRSEPLDDRLQTWTAALLGAIRWHGIAMVEFRYDRRADRFTLMEINGRFQSSVALSLDAGLNLPYAVACLFAGEPLPSLPPYKPGVTERWIRGDVLALRGAIATRQSVRSDAPPSGAQHRTAVAHLVRDFFADFRPGVHLDEFKWWDPKPGVVEGWRILKTLAAWGADSVRRLARRAAERYNTRSPAAAAESNPDRTPVTASARVVTHDSMRA